MTDANLPEGLAGEVVGASRHSGRKAIAAAAFFGRLKPVSNVVADLTSKLKPDEWRIRTPFADDFRKWHDSVINAGSTSAIEELENDWLQRHQPCLFGRLAAKASAITYCVLNDADLASSDDVIANKIQDRRFAWSRAAYSGRSSAFVIVVVSDRIARAVPDSTVGQLARRLTFLYLRRDIDFDKIYTDEIALEFPGEERLTRVWPTGVNYFCAQADGRWWQDHRIPGGMALSVNSVGHLVRSGRIQNAFELLRGDLDQAPVKRFKIDSLEKALEFAMRTIDKASEAPGGKATRLLPLDAARTDLKCPVELPAFLREKDFCSYWGGYHTDVTLPSEYFAPDVKRPDDAKAHSLDFTYLFLKDLENPDFESMGDGRRIRASNFIPLQREGVEKRLRGAERVVEIEDTVLLRQALAADNPPR